MAIIKIYKSVRNAFRGLKHAYNVDKSFRMEVWGALGFIFVGYLLWPLSGTETIVLSFSYGLILITELVNTSVEQLLERLHPERHEIIGRSKDIASSAVLIAFVLAIVALLVLLFNQYSS